MKNENKITDNPVVVNEITELRGENSKVFRMSDGTNQAVFYSGGVLESEPNFESIESSVFRNTERKVLTAANIETESKTTVVTYSWKNGTVSSGSVHEIGTSSDSGARRMYIKLSMPAMPRNPRIKKAELKFFQYSGTSVYSTDPKVGLYKVTEDITVGDGTPACNTDLIDYNLMKSGTSENGEMISYIFDITKFIDISNKNGTANVNLVLKPLNENRKVDEAILLYGSSSAPYAPQLSVTYESSYGINTSYGTVSQDIGRFGHGYVDLVCGNLMLESEDFAWQGNRMPVTIKHLYNSALSAYQYTANSQIMLNTADFSAMKIGNGFKLNLMQSIVPASFQHDGKPYEGYVYIGENGDETYFKQSDKTEKPAGGSSYNLYEDTDGSGILYDPIKKTLTLGGDVYLFDSDGRLTKITDEHGNCMTVSYISGRISSVTDGIGRIFAFAYDTDGFLTSITAPDNTSVSYTYSANRLSSVTYPDGRKASLTYASGKPARITLSENGTNIGRTMFSYDYDSERVLEIIEYGVENGTFEEGMSTSFSYSISSRKTTVTLYDPEEEVSRTVYTFDCDGNTVSEYQYSRSMGNIGTVTGGGVVTNINNLLSNHNFETLTGWSAMPENAKTFSFKSYSSESEAQYGKSLLRMQSTDTSTVANGVYQQTESLPKGDYTFSVYATSGYFSGSSSTKGCYIRVVSSDGSVLAESEHLADNVSEQARLVAPFTLTAAEEVTVQILLDGSSTCYFDAAQLEKNPSVNAYNMLENGSFENGSAGWSATAGTSLSFSSGFNMSKALLFSGDVEKERQVYQKVNVKKLSFTRETFTLSGWAKGYGIVNRERDGAEPPKFCLCAVIKYTDAEIEEYTAEFSPCTEEWQFASVQFAKQKRKSVDNVTVYCDYSYNFGTVYFDCIQLVRDNIEENLTANDFYTEPEEEIEETSSVKETSPDFEELTDSFGNTLTETTFTNGEIGTIYRSFGFSENGNDQISETDSRGNITEYTVDGVSSRQETVTDRNGNKVEYTYDSSGRTSKVTNKKANGVKISDVSYTYNAFDNLNKITRGDGLSYNFDYDCFNNLKSIGVDGKAENLVSYTYKNGAGRLEKITYANGDNMNATYNSLGQLIAEKWYDKDGNLTSHMKFGYDNAGNLVNTIDITAKKDYTYIYEGGKLVRAVESIISLSGEIVTKKTVQNKTAYTYDENGQLTRKRISITNGSVYSENYEYPEDGNIIVRYNNGNGVLSHSKNDSFGRKVFDEVQFGKGFVSRQFTYHSGKETEALAQKGKLKSSPITSLVKMITYDDGRTLEYEYDGEERITKLTDSFDGVTEYTYDELGQLLTEKHNGVVINSMTYDNYGNIKTKNGVSYTYDSVWKDLLTKVGSQTITYDEQGNPTNYLGHTLTWEKGRQLKSFDTNTYTYNAKGIRTGKKTKQLRRDLFITEGSKLVYEDRNYDGLVPLYDNEGNVCGIRYAGLWFFQKNLQGDVIAIKDSKGNTVARYRYDAWGVPTIIEDITPDDEDWEGDGIATVNPFRYRGYYYDNETGLYYLQSRYYDPTIGRFINADNVVVGTNSIVTIYNLYSYCRNNVANLIDPDGKWPKVYIRLRDIRVNCYGYALGRTEFRQVPVSFGSSVDTVAAAVLKDLSKIGIRSYIITTKNPHLYTNSKYYAIALRVGYRKDKFLLTKGVYDYHFWVKHQNGTWSHKPGQLTSIYMGNCNPSTKSWDLITKVKELLPGFYTVQQSIKNFYNSKTVYIAVEKK